MMRTLLELRNQLGSYEGVDYLYYQGMGYIAWHVSTGDNLEVLFIEAKSGCGSWIYRKLVENLLETGNIPYHSIFCFRLETNQQAARFYHKMGWTQVYLEQSIYRDDGTVLCWITWQDLLKTLKVKEQTDERDKKL